VGLADLQYEYAMLTARVDLAKSDKTFSSAGRRYSDWFRMELPLTLELECRALVGPRFDYPEINAVQSVRLCFGHGSHLECGHVGTIRLSDGAVHETLQSTAIGIVSQRRSHPAIRGELIKPHPQAARCI
jgi:hypothetical protein